ncbi:ABC transporter permease [Phycicoccus endophyticus]|uniref:ABC transporter permease n=1 Tax=Phycicoccus endophyticus TaxID=1690220 RepID=A0A7G9QYS0_9MICO|nr:ABC transporter permease [Phycicoccus endophyticus]NHI20467.1 ABC transporter permease [Phycicoccus endophyticus]QNN48495.1 ABC transporter permease [Phycicoccus endophyticus]GGL30547.1 ABC transporter permease [Phycicoccus endophyticus]
MGTYIVRRLLQMIPVLIGATFLIFAMVFALPGDPLDGKCGERACPPAYAAAFEEKYNLNDPLPVQYFKYVGNLAHGDFGETYNGIKVSDQLKERYPVTVKLGTMAVVIEAILGILAGVLTGIRKGGFLDNLVLIATLVVISIPIFVIGGLAQYFLAVKWGLFPVTVTSGEATFYQLLLPAIVLGSLSVAYVARLTRTNLAENLRSDYVRTAISKGLTKRRAYGLHALRNSLIPVVTFIGFDFGALLGGAIVTESIFNIPGVGNYIFRSIKSRDGASVVGAVTVLVLVYLVVNLIVDLLYGLLDPRISHD